MSAAKVIVLILGLLLMGMLVYYGYQAVTKGGAVPNEVKEDAQYPMAIGYAEQLRFYEALSAMLVFPLLGWALAEMRLPPWSWLRNFLAAFAVVILIFVVFANLMEARFQERFAGAPLPLESVMTALIWAGYGTLAIFTLLFASGLVHRWRVGRHARG
jgi:hypothetical protein